MGIRSLSSSSISTGAKRSKFWDQSAAIFIPGSYYSIATATSTGQTSLTLSSIPQIYQHLEIRFRINDSIGSGENYYMGFNGNNNSNYMLNPLTAGYGGSTVSSQVYSGDTWIKGADFANASQAPSTTKAIVGVVRINNYRESGQRRTLQSFMTDVVSGGGAVRVYSSSWTGTDALTSITILTDSNATIRSGSVVALYGLSGS